MAFTDIPDVPIYTGVAPNRNTQQQAEFSANSDDSLDYQATLADNLNTTTAAINVVADEVQVVADQSEVSNAQSASSAAASAVSANISASNANFKGNWSDQTGAASIPYSVNHNDKTWQLLQNIADVTTQAPAENAFWTEIQPSSFTGTKVHLGEDAGVTNQGVGAVAGGWNAGNLNQATNAVAIGPFSGNSNQGSGSVSVGQDAGNSSQGTESVAIGRGAGQTNQPANSIVLNSDSSNNTPLSTKEILIGRVDYNVRIGDGNVQSVSDANDKYDITDSPIGLDFINELRPCFYKYDIRELYEETIEIKDDEDNVIGYRTIKHTPDGSKAGKRNHAGLIAQDVKITMDKHGVDFGLFRDESIGAEHVHKDRASDKLALCYMELIPVLIKSVQELSALSEKQGKQIEELLASK